MRVAEYPNLRAAADLLTQVVFQSPAIPCLGARQVAFYTKATGGNFPAASGIEVSLDGGVTWLTAALSADFVAQRGNINGSDNTTGRAIVGSPRDTGAANGSGPTIAATHARLTVTGHGTLTVTGLQASGRVFYGDGEGVLVSVYPTPAS